MSAILIKTSACVSNARFYYVFEDGFLSLALLLLNTSLSSKNSSDMFLSPGYSVEAPANAVHLSGLRATKELLSFESRKDTVKEEADPKQTGKKQHVVISSILHSLEQREKLHKVLIEKNSVLS